MKKDLIIIVCLFSFPLFLNLFKLTDLPPGIYSDEVSLGRKALELVNSRGLTPFMGEYSHPTPLLYLAALSINIFGHTVEAIRMPIVIIGALNPVVFYFLIRKFIDQKAAILGGLLFACSYTGLVLNRLAYEPPASTFFQILFFLFLTRSSYKWAGLALGMGLYTYLNFRVFFVFATLGSVLMLKKKSLIIILFAAIISLPLVLYAINDPQGFFLRSSEISVFGRGLPANEVTKELYGSTTRTLGSFGMVGDPNPGKNPSGVPIIDPLTSILFLAGFALLFKTNKKYFGWLCLFLLAAICADIFSIEQIPEFHYYGLGHPNALRVSGLLLPVIFGAVYALSKLKYKLAVVITGIICFLNLFCYFNQKDLNPRYFSYNYRVNRTTSFNIMKTLNQVKANNVFFSKDLGESEYPWFFLDNNIKVVSSSESAKTIALLVNDNNKNLIEELVAKYENNKRVQTLLFKDLQLTIEGAILFLF